MDERAEAQTHVNDQQSQDDGPPYTGQSEPDYYAALGISWLASHAVVHAAYRRLIKRWHPDHFTNAPRRLRLRAERQVRLLTAAYAVLGDEERRRAYDERMRRYSANVYDAIHGAAAYSATHEHTTHGPRTVAHPGAFGPAHEATNNPNGAGQLAAVLALMLAVGLFGGMLNGGLGSTLGASIVFGGLLVFLLLSYLFLTSESRLARSANTWMNGDPRGFRTYAPPQQHTAHAAPHAEDDLARFEGYVDDALAQVPPGFRDDMANLVVQVRDEPTEEELSQLEVVAGTTLFGLYHGVPLTSQGIAGAAPELITIYRLPIERACGGDQDLIREEARVTVLHEVAHHFGIDHDHMPEWVR